MLDELKDLAQRNYVSSYRIAAIYAGLEEKDQAFAWLGRAFAERDAWLTWLRWIRCLMNFVRSALPGFIKERWPDCH